MQPDRICVTHSSIARLPEVLTANGHSVPLHFVRHPRARRYVLRIDRSGAARVTVPRSGSLDEARRFADRHVAWIESQLARRATAPRSPVIWTTETTFLFRGERLQVSVTDHGHSAELRFADQVIPAPPPEADLRPAIERHLRELAAVELPARVRDYATVHQLEVHRIQVRAQRSRWGSCSRRGTISLNWRLIQAPPFVRDYLILHELMHLRQMNHSARFWREVESVCPFYAAAECWLKKFGREILHD